MTLLTVTLIALLLGVLMVSFRYLFHPLWIGLFFGGGPLLMVVNAGRLDLQAFTWAKVLTLSVSVALIAWLPRSTGAAQRRLAVSVCVILVLNILEAVAADALGGRWVNAVVGAVLVATVAGPRAVSVTRVHGRPAMAYDLPWRWIVTYSIWNITVVCGNYPLHWCEHFAVLAAPILATTFGGDRRSWLEARAFTLSVFAVGIVLVIDVLGWPWIPDSPSPLKLYPWLSGLAAVGGAWTVAGWIKDRSVARAASAAGMDR